MTREAAQRHRVNRVINFVHANLHSDIDLHRLSNVACLSKFHFVRVFDSHIGQTPLRYLNRIRLERAARQLIYLPSTPVGTVAGNCGFTSHHSFSRSFSRHFGCTPHEFKQLKNYSDTEIPIVGFDGISGAHGIRIECRPQTRIAYIRHFGPYRRNEGGIYTASQRIREWAESIGLTRRQSMIGLYPDNRRITPAQHCVYDVGVVVDNSIGEDDIVSVLTIPAGHYAIANVRCRNEQIISAWDCLITRWRVSRKARYEQRWSYEVFTDTQDGTLNPERGVQLCLRLSDYQ